MEEEAKLISRGEGERDIKGWSNRILTRKGSLPVVESPI